MWRLKARPPPKRLYLWYKRMLKLRCKNDKNQCDYCQKVNDAKQYTIGAALCEFGIHLWEEHQRTFFVVHHANMKMRGDTGLGTCGWCQKTHTEEELIELNKFERELVKDCICGNCIFYRTIVNRNK